MTTRTAVEFNSKLASDKLNLGSLMTEMPAVGRRRRLRLRLRLNRGAPKPRLLLFFSSLTPPSHARTIRSFLPSFLPSFPPPQVFLAMRFGVSGAGVLVALTLLPWAGFGARHGVVLPRSSESESESEPQPQPEPEWYGPGPHVELDIVNRDISPDGFLRPSVLAGGTLPGKVISGNKGDRFRINVTNRLVDGAMDRSTSIHWHGLFQRGSIWADGPAFVSQCPITSGHSFKYDFAVPDQAGTFWYHSHLGTQYCDGLRGALVVYDPWDPMSVLYDVDDESTIISLMDWYHIPSLAEGRIPIPDSTLINGLGRHPGGPQSDLAVITVERGVRYRFRLINMACLPDYVFSIDGHVFTVVEVDGTTHQPYVVDSLRIFAGQRFSIILEANQPVDNYWIRANPAFGQDGFDGGINSAILRYSGAPEGEPKTVQTPSIMPLVEAALRPLNSSGVPGRPEPGGADVVLNLDLAFDFDKFQFLVNGVSFVLPSVPVLLQILSGARRAQDLMPSGSIIPLPPGKVVEISIPAGVVGGEHPFHLHGHDFHVVRSAGSGYNFVDPPVRDVVSIGNTGDNVTIRFVTDDPGPWLLHCHIDWHLKDGLAIVLAEDVDYINAYSEHVPDAWEELCPIYAAQQPE